MFTDTSEENWGLRIWMGGELLAMLQKVFSSDPQQPHTKHMSVVPVLRGVGTRGLGRSVVDPCS